MEEKREQGTFKGINSSVRLDILLCEEKRIVERLSRQYWYVTRVQEVHIGESLFRVALIKPTTLITQKFNLVREVVVIFSSYERFEPRAFDVLSELNIQELRLEEICSIIISKDNNISQSISNILKSNQESRIFVPFSYAELDVDVESFDDYFLDKMRKCFYSRDLFGIQDPLKQELYFFGRRELIQELVNKNLCGENSGIFGLRKTGKTSILYGVERALSKKNTISTFVDCQTLHNKPWNLALQYIISNIAKNCEVKKRVYEANYRKYELEESASDAFYEDLNNIMAYIKTINVLLIFDEVENITFGTSVTETWSTGYSFIKFWQTIRSAYQRLNRKNKFTYLIAGTNPRCVEVATIMSTDNPIFHQFAPIYIAPFDHAITKDMLDRLGGYMGIKFSPEVYTHIVEDFGGHPLLMRQVCSYIHRQYHGARPFVVDKSEYEIYKQQFYKDQAGFTQYANMILEVLSKWYPDEYQMLEMLAVDDIESFKFFSEDSNYIIHLRNYGIIAQDRNGFHFKIEALQEYLRKKNRYKRPLKAPEDKEQEIQIRRSAIEKKLRNLVRRQLKSLLGEDLAKKEMIRAIYSSKEINKWINSTYKDFFDPLKHNITLNKLFTVIKNNYDKFEKLFNVNQAIFDSKSTLFNSFRKVDAHSAQMSDADFETFRGIASWFEGILEDE